MIIFQISFIYWFFIYEHWNLHQESRFNIFISFFSFRNILCSGIEIILIKTITSFSENSLSTFLYLPAWKRMTLLNKCCEQLALNITQQNLYLVTSGISLKIPPNHKNIQKSRRECPTDICKWAFSISSTIPIGLNRKRNNASNKNGVRQGPLYKVSFKLGPIIFEVAPNAKRSFVELWSSLMTAWCGKYLTFLEIPMLSTFSITPCSTWSVIALSCFA